MAHEFRSHIRVTCADCGAVRLVPVRKTGTRKKPLRCRACSLKKTRFNSNARTEYLRDGPERESWL